jgi:phosphotransferase system  glucose/maltose/N-acetylglucosamine-specific IIC component
MLASIYLRQGSFGFLHVLASCFIQAAIISTFTCPLSLSLSMHMATMMSSIFMTISAYSGVPPDSADGRVWEAVGTLGACLVFAFILPLIRMASQETVARAHFLRELRQQLRMSGVRVTPEDNNAIRRSS